VRQLSVLVSTGTPMIDAITSLEKQLPSGEWRTALAGIRARIEEGSPFSVAVESQPRYFDGVARSLIAAGESGGQLDEMLKRLATLTRQQLKVRASILGALAYPCVLVFISINVLLVMLFFVLPRFEGLFQSLGSPLPPTTQLLMNLSDLLRQYWWGALGGALAIGVGGWMYLGTAAGRQMIHTAAVKAPIIGRVARALIAARVTRVLGVLLAGKVPMLEALSLTRQASGNMLYEALLQRAEELVTKGDNVSTALADSPLLSRSVVEAMRSGERSGQLSTVLLDLSDFMDEDNEIVLRSLSTIIEPIILIFLGVIIGFVAVSMFLPLFDLATAAKGGGA
jgi:type IV pilus assembly protein PilC